MTKVNERGILVWNLDALPADAIGADGTYSDFLEGLIIQGPGEPPPFVDLSLIRPPDVAWCTPDPVRALESLSGASKRVYMFTEVSGLPEVAPADWLAAMAAAGESRPRLRMAEAVAGFADRVTGRNVRPANGTIAEVTGKTRKAVNKSVRALVDRGWLTVTGKAAKGVIEYALAVPV